VAAVQPSKGAPQTPKDVLSRLIYELENSDPEKADSVKDSERMMARLYQLQDFGEEGTKAIQEFLKTQQDIVLSKGRSRFDNDSGRSKTSIRTAMLDLLHDINDPIAQAASLEVLQATSSGQEVLRAARNLEKSSPGTYKDEVLKAVSEIPSKPPETDESGRIDGAMSLLDQLEPQLNTPILQQRLQDARKNLQKQLENTREAKEAKAGESKETESTPQTGP